MGLGSSIFYFFLFDALGVRFWDSYLEVERGLAIVRDLVLNNLGGDCGREVALVHAGPVATGCLAERPKGRMRAAVDDAPCHNGLHRYH